MTRYSDELYHYGVLGMKWGVHRARQNAKKASRLRAKAESNPDKADKLNAKAAKYEAKSTYTYKSHGTKKYDRKAARVEKKLAKTTDPYKREVLQEKKLKYEYRANRSRTTDAREQRYAARVKTGGNIVARYLTNGAIGGKPYQQYLAMMKGTGSGNYVKKAAATAAAVMGGRLGSTAVKALYMRSGESNYIEENLKKH